MITTEELQAWREACEKASCEPWSIDGRNERGLGEPDGIDHITNGDDDSIITADSGVYGPDMPDAEFICLSRTALPRAIAEIEDLRAEVVDWRKCDSFGIAARGELAAGLIQARAERDRYAKVFEAAKAWREEFELRSHALYPCERALLDAIDAAIAEQEGRPNE